jgi:hypothetical protein
MRDGKSLQLTAFIARSNDGEHAKHILGRRWHLWTLFWHETTLQPSGFSPNSFE